jgi:hypothetical protein
MLFPALLRRLYANPTLPFTSATQDTLLAPQTDSSIPLNLRIELGITELLSCSHYGTVSGNQLRSSIDISYSPLSTFYLEEVAADYLFTS